MTNESPSIPGLHCKLSYDHPAIAGSVTPAIPPTASLDADVPERVIQFPSAGYGAEALVSSSVTNPPSLNDAKPLDPLGFPNPPRAGSSFLPATIPNILHLLTSYGIAVSNNVITKKIQIKLPGASTSGDTSDSAGMTNIISLAALNGIGSGQIYSYVDAISDLKPHNPVADWIESRPWDGVNRLPEIYGTLTEKEGFPEPLKQILLQKWLLSAVAAALMPRGFKARGVLTFQGLQGIGKTSWLMSLVPDMVLRNKVVKVDHHLDPSNKDSVLGAIVHWLVEIGELDSSFRKDVARLKGFLTSDSDKVRRPYARTESEYPRKTVFFATVNESNFLVDSTGNTRWWTIPLEKINHMHDIDTQQLFAQLAVSFKQGDPWWLTADEERMLEACNGEHRVQSYIRELMMESVDFVRPPGLGDQTMTPIELLRKLDVKFPNNAQCRECGSILREFPGNPKKIRGLHKWRIPFRLEPLSLITHKDDEGEY